MFKLAKTLICGLFLILAGADPGVAQWRTSPPEAAVVSGTHGRLGVSYTFDRQKSERSATGDVIRFEIAIRGRGALRGTFAPITGEVSIRFVGLDGRPRPIRASDKARLQALIDDPPPMIDADDAHVFNAAVSTLLIAPLERQIDLKFKAGDQDEGTEQARSITSLCSRLGTRYTGSYTDANANTVQKSIALPGCMQPTGGCLGRCGTGCLGPGAPGTSVLRYTDHCLSLDLCVQRYGSSSPHCRDEAVRATDDLWGARDCASLTGTWSGLGATLRLSEKSTSGASAMPITGTAVVDECRYTLYLSSRVRDGGRFTLFGRRAPGVSTECCSGGTIVGSNLRTSGACERISVKGAAFCGGSRSGVMVRQ